jgi:Phage tail protein (Tail_P2_I)
MPSSKIIDYIPVYARLLDERGILEHFATHLQTQIDDCLKAIELAETIFDPNTCPPQWLHYTAQTVGMSNYGPHYLGVGLRSEWADWYKREVIQRFSQYTAQKGTEWAIREAIDLWLQWPPAHDDQRLSITMAMGDRIVRDLPGYQNDRTRYGQDRLRMFTEKKLIGGGDQARFTWTTYRTLSGKAYSVYNRLWSDRRLTLDKRTNYASDGSVMAPQRPRMNFYLAESEWNLIFPNILTLNREIWNTFASPYVYGWLTYGAPIIVLELAPELKNLDIEIDSETGLATLYETTEYPVIAGMQYGQIWTKRTQWNSQFITTIKTDFIKNEPGHRFGDQWNIAIKSGMLYRPRKRQVTWKETSLQPNQITCTPGDFIEVQTGVESIDISAIWTNSNTIQSRLSAIDFSGEFPFYLDLRPDGRIETEYIEIDRVRDVGLFELTISDYIEAEYINIDDSQIETDRVPIREIQLGSYLPSLYLEISDRIDVLYSNKTNYLEITDYIQTDRIVTQSPARLIERYPATSHSFGHIWGRSPIYHRPKQPSRMTLHVDSLETHAINVDYIQIEDRLEMSGVARTIERKIKKKVRLCNVNGYKKRSILNRVKTRSKLSDSYSLFDTYPILKTVSQAENWELQFQADRLYKVRPSTMFWAKSTDGKILDDRALQPDIQTGRLNLYLEFLIDCDRSINLEGLSLRLQGEVLIGRHFPAWLNLTQGTAFGVRIGVPLRFSSNTSTIVDDWAFWNYSQQLQDQYEILRSRLPLEISDQILPERKEEPIVNPIEPDLRIAPTETSLIDLLRDTSESMQIIINNLSRISETGNKVFSKTLRNPIIETTAGAIKSTFTLSSGLGSHNFTIATLTTISEPITEIARPEIRLIGTDSIEFIFWSDEPIDSDDIQVWICEGSKLS